jgi:glutathione S-transferase
LPTLYEFPPARSQRAKWALEELGVRYDSHMVNLMEGAHKTDDYRKVHPLGVVPAYKTDTYTLIESVAIVLQLIDEHPTPKLAPSMGTPQRAIYYQWCIFGPAELDGPLTVVTQNELFLPVDRRDAAAAKHGRALFAPRAQMLSDALQNRDYLLREGFSGADIVIGYNCFWATFTGLLNDYPVLQQYLARLQGRPAFQRAFANPKAQ